ncbi:hypothetical protein ARMSODRAFT_946747, partial [Armillaria solidipes]
MEQRFCGALAAMSMLQSIDLALALCQMTVVSGNPGDLFGSWNFGVLVILYPAPQLHRTGIPVELYHMHHCSFIKLSVEIVVLVRTSWASNSSISVFANTVGVLYQVTLLYCKDGPSYLFCSDRCSLVRA